MLKRSDVVALSKAALQRVACRKSGVIPPNPKHLERLARRKKEQQGLEAANDVHERELLKAAN